MFLESVQEESFRTPAIVGYFCVYECVSVLVIVHVYVSVCLSVCMCVYVCLGFCVLFRVCISVCAFSVGCFFFVCACVCDIMCAKHSQWPHTGQEITWNGQVVRNNSLVTLSVVPNRVSSSAYPYYPLVCQGITGGQWYEPSGVLFPPATPDPVSTPGGLWSTKCVRRSRAVSWNSFCLPTWCSMLYQYHHHTLCWNVQWSQTSSVMSVWLHQMVTTMVSL